MLNDQRGSWLVMTMSGGWRWCVALVILIAWNTVLAETGTLVISDSSPVQARFEAWEDPEGKAGIDEVTALPDEHWQEVPTGSETFGITSSAYWLKFAVENRTHDSLNLIAELAYSQLDGFPCFFPGGTGQKVQDR